MSVAQARVEPERAFIALCGRPVSPLSGQTDAKTVMEGRFARRHGDSALDAPDAGDDVAARIGDDARSALLQERVVTGLRLLLHGDKRDVG